MVTIVWVQELAKRAHTTLPQAPPYVAQVGEMWQQASSADKAPYLEISQADKTRYHFELEAYNYRSTPPPKTLYQ
jgi:hypothetical protein